VHSGYAVRESDDFFGRSVIVAARVAALAEGGEILASETVAHLAGRDEEVRYAPRRPAAVKGVAEPIRFVEVLPTVELPPAPSRPSLKPRRSRRRIVLLTCVGLLLAAGVAVAVRLPMSKPPLQATAYMQDFSGVKLQIVNSPGARIGTRRVTRKAGAMRR